MAVLVIGGRGGIGRCVVRGVKSLDQEVLILDAVDGHDACDPRDVDRVLAGCTKLDGLVHLAGTTGVGGIAQHDLTMWRRVMDDNLTSAFVVLKAALPRLEVDGGSVVLCSSVNGRTGGNELSGPAYAAAKAGLIGLAKHVATHHAAAGVRCNAVAPGPVATAMVDRLNDADLEALLATVPLNRVTPPEEIADLILFLLSPASASITGATVDVNGGMWMA